MYVCIYTYIGHVACTYCVPACVLQIKRNPVSIVAYMCMGTHVNELDIYIGQNMHVMSWGDGWAGVLLWLMVLITYGIKEQKDFYIRKRLIKEIKRRPLLSLYYIYMATWLN